MSEGVYLNVICAPGQEDRCVEAMVHAWEYDGIRISPWTGCPRGTAIVIDKDLNFYAWDLDENS